MDDNWSLRLERQVPQFVPIKPNNVLIFFEQLLVDGCSRFHPNRPIIHIKGRRHVFCRVSSAAYSSFMSWWWETNDWFRRTRTHSIHMVEQLQDECKSHSMLFKGDIVDCRRAFGRIGSRHRCAYIGSDHQLKVPGNLGPHRHLQGSIWCVETLHRLSVQYIVWCNPRNVNYQITHMGGGARHP